MSTRFRNALLLVGVGAAAFGLGTGISVAQDDGTTDPAPTEEQQAQRDQREAFRQCLEDNGAPQPDRGEGPRGRRGGPPPELSDEDAAALEQAWAACTDLIPQPTAEQQAQIDAFEACMAENGIDLPEIDRTVPPTQRPEKPEFDEETMQAAREACADLKPEGIGHGPGHGGPGGPGCDKGHGPRGEAPGDAPAEDAPEAEGSSFQPV